MNTTTISLASGIHFDILNPTPETITIGDIAWALSMLCRFNGHTLEFYSVAQHSVAVSRRVDERYQLTALLHDASEAFIGDVTRPLKHLMPEYKTIESNIEQFIAVKFGLIYPFPEQVTQADNDMLEYELGWRNGTVRIEYLSHKRAYNEFIKQYYLLMKKREQLTGLIK